MYQFWSEEEKNFIQEYAGRLKDEDLVKVLYSKFGVIRNFSSVRKMRQRLGVKKAHGRGICQILDG